MFKRSFAVLAIALGLCAPAFAQQNMGGYDDGRSVVIPAANSAHSASQSLGGMIEVSAFRTTGQASAIIDNVLLGSQSGLTGSMTLYAFRVALSAGSTCTDSVAFTLAAADALNLAFQPITLTPVASQGVTQTTAQQAMTVSVRNYDAPQNLPYIYVCLVANETITPASTSDLWLTLSTAQD